MNKKVKEIANKVGIVPLNDMSSFGFDENMNSYYCKGHMLEALVKSIVLECADICVNENVSILDINVIQTSSKFAIQDLATRSCGENLAKQIKKHFDVDISIKPIPPANTIKKEYEE
jgi:dihydropteroate synthase